MKTRVILLCGGAGTRFTNIYPKPMNLVNGIPMINHVVKYIDCPEITVIYNAVLDSFGFTNCLSTSFSFKKFVFIPIDFQTRGPAETLFIGLKSVDHQGQVLVLDNDNIYGGMLTNSLPQGNFIIYNDNPTGLSHYSFVKLGKDKKVTAIEERKPISQYVCMGGYGFESVQVCREFCKQVIMSDEAIEPYLSIVFKLMLEGGLVVNAHYLPGSFSIGTEKDIIHNHAKLERSRIRVVFDLDNTIVSYPSEFLPDGSKNYSCVKPIPHIVQFMKHLKEAGHEIVIYTARNTLTCGHNVGQVMKNVGLRTMQSLADLNIEYDELFFGKPYGDLYVDDKAFNTYDLELFKQMGFYDVFSQPATQLYNFKTNKYNNIRRVDRGTINKTGPDLKGEIFYYNSVARSEISDLFPKLISHENDCSIFMEYIQGASLSKIYFEGLLQPTVLQNLIDTVSRLHDTSIYDVALTVNDIDRHYFDKFEARSLARDDYPFDDFFKVYSAVQAQLRHFLDLRIPLIPVIHGDLWFSNILIYKKKFKFIDMRGIFNGQLTLNGHAIYDWAKLYQSILGLDAIIDYGENVDALVQASTEEEFWQHLLRSNVINSAGKILVVRMAGYLIYNTFHAYRKDFPLARKHMIWALVKKCIE